MKIKMRFRAKAHGDVVKVIGLIKHPNLTYIMAEKQHKKVNFLTYIKATHNGEVVYEVSTSQFLSKDPVLKFAFKGGKKGDVLEVYAEDYQGNKGTKKVKIK